MLLSATLRALQQQTDRLYSKLLPIPCTLCQQITEKGSLCDYCLETLPYLSRSCLHCASPLTAGSVCGACLKHPPPFDKAWSCLRYEGATRRLISQFKFQQQLHLASCFAEIMSERLSLDNEPTTLVPIPLHPRRLRERGYNQANLVAKKISQLLQLPMRTDMLQRNKYTSPQSQLDFHHRRRNLRSAFICHEVDMPRHITLIDDVMTSGETLKSATKALKYHGVQHVQVWTIARAISHH